MPEPERRYFRRVQKVIEFQYTSNGPPMTGGIRDLSEGGVYVDTPDPLSAGTPVSFRFVLQPISKTPILGRGLVRWCEDAVGMGIQFLAMSDEDRALIRRFVMLEPDSGTSS
jgi:uncharacterized protein (TIGR02266 family)